MTEPHRRRPYPFVDVSVKLIKRGKSLNYRPTERLFGRATSQKIGATFGSAVLLAAVAFAANGGAASATPATSATSATPTEVAESTSAVRAMPGLASCPGGPKGTLIQVNDTGGPYADDFNPFSAPPNTGSQFSFVYEPLLQFSLTEPNAVTPWLASGYSWSDGGKTLTFNLRHGVTWSDGKPFTSADVVFTFKELQKYPAANLKGITFKSVTAEGAFGVKMTFSAPAYGELYYIGTQYIVPMHIWSSLGNPTKVQNNYPVGTGPYLLTSLSLTNLTLTANPHYWQKGLPCVETITAPPADSNTTADLELDQGGGDWGGVFVSDLKKYTAQGYHKYYFPPLYDASFCTNLDEEPLSSLPLREAISDALNRTSIVGQAENGELLPVKNVTGLVLPRDKDVLSPAYANADFPSSMSKAKTVLESAGYTYHNGVLLTPAKKPVAFTIQAPAANSDSVAAMEAVYQELKALGIDVTLDDIPNTQWLDNLEFGKFQASICYSQNGPNSFYIYNGFLNGSNTAPVGKLATTNYDRFNSAQANKLIASYLDTDNAAIQKSDMEGLENIMASQIPVMPLFYQTDWGEYSTQHFSGWPDAANPYDLDSTYDTPMNEVVALHLTYHS